MKIVLALSALVFFTTALPASAGHGVYRSRTVIRVPGHGHHSGRFAQFINGLPFAGIAPSNGNGLATQIPLAQRPVDSNRFAGTLDQTINICQSLGVPFIDDRTNDDGGSDGVAPPLSQTFQQAFPDVFEIPAGFN